MKMSARVVPYSSVVGSSVTIHAENNLQVCQLSLLSVIPPGFRSSREHHRQASEALAKWVAERLDGADFDAARAHLAALYVQGETER